MARPIDPNKRKQIVDAARTLLHEKGYAQTRMSDIAHVAGIAAGTLYLYFPSKEALAQALADDYLERLAEALRPHLYYPDPAQSISDCAAAALSFSEQERDELRLLGLTLGLGTSSERTTGQMELYQMLADALKWRIERGEIAPYDPQVLAELIGGMFEWVSQQILFDGSGERARYEETLVQLMQRALLTKGLPRLQDDAVDGKERELAEA